VLVRRSPGYALRGGGTAFVNAQWKLTSPGQMVDMDPIRAHTEQGEPVALSSQIL